MWTTTWTPPVERSVKVAHPRTFDPLRGSIVAFACAPAGGFAVDAHAATRAIAAAAAKPAAKAGIRTVFIFPPGVRSETRPSR
jgi:hypothetical protein